MILDSVRTNPTTSIGIGLVVRVAGFAEDVSPVCEPDRCFLHAGRILPLTPPGSLVLVGTDLTIG